MPSFYTVAYYVPDPVADERINFGVIVFGGPRPLCRFVRNWSRITRFGKRSHIAHLQEFSERVTLGASAAPTLPPPVGRHAYTEQLLKGIAQSWMNTIQFSPLKASLLRPAELLDEVTGRYLWEPTPEPGRRARDRRRVVIEAERILRDALAQRDILNPDSYIHHQGDASPLQGEFELHSFDLSVENGRVYVAAKTISFEGSDEARIARDVDSVAWALSDVSRQHRDTPLSLLAFPPTEPTREFERAADLCRHMNVPFVGEQEFHQWAERIADRVSRNGDSHRRE